MSTNTEGEEFEAGFLLSRAGDASRFIVKFIEIVIFMAVLEAAEKVTESVFASALSILIKVAFGLFMGAQVARLVPWMSRLLRVRVGAFANLASVVILSVLVTAPVIVGVASAVNALVASKVVTL